jgi:hypothetical protein
MKKKSSYQIMKSILNGYKATKEEKESINAFFFIRWLSFNPKSVFISNVFNRFYKEIPIYVQYDISKQLLKGKINYIQFPKKQNDTSEILDNIVRYYKVSLSTAKEYYSIMSEEEKEKFKNLYKGA